MCLAVLRDVFITLIMPVNQIAYNLKAAAWVAFKHSLSRDQVPPAPVDIYVFFVSRISLGKMLHFVVPLLL